MSPFPAAAAPPSASAGTVAGGGYGQLSRKHGLVVDHLYAVEVVVVDRTGRARRVVATREPTDPNRDLWWAFTGGGGGNFGVVTRYWLRSPDATGDDPAKLLPVPPAALLKCSITWQWKDMTEQAFTTIVRNHGEFHAQTAGPESGLSLAHRVAGAITVDATLDTATPHARQVMDDYVAALTADVGVPHTTSQVTTPWMKATLAPSPWPSGARFKSKAAFLRRPWSAAQIATIHRYLSEGGPQRWGGAVYLTTFGGKINTVPPSATAMVHRDAIFSAVYETLWVEPAETEQQLAWIRGLYRDVYASTGGVPVPDAANGGAYINYPDTDLADPQWNTSGVPWHALYYGDNYPRLQQVKERWDPRNVFRHALSSRV
ncbi:MAG: BBE domain-containing protein [Pseudonocardiaceae bacterium]